MCDKTRINKICNRRNHRDRLVKSSKKSDVFRVEWVMSMSKGGPVKDCDVQLQFTPKWLKPCWECRTSVAGTWRKAESLIFFG